MTTFFTNEVLINFLIWAFGVTGAALLSIVVWLAVGVMRGQRDSDDKSDLQFKAFGQQLTAVKDLVIEDLHKHDVRIARLEEWRKAYDHEVKRTTGDDD